MTANNANARYEAVTDVFIDVSQIHCRLALFAVVCVIRDDSY